MTSRYFAALFILAFTALYIGLTYLVDEVRLSHFVIVWVLCGFFAGQYSMRYKKG